MVTRTWSVGVDSRIFAHDPTTNAVTSEVLGNLHQQTNSLTTYGPLLGYKGKITRGEEATTPLSGTFYRTTWGPGSEYYVKVTNRSSTPPFITHNRRTGAFFGTPIPSLASSTASFNRANNMALQKLATNALNAQREFSSLVSAGELGETIRGILNPAKAFRGRLNEYLFAVKKRFRGRRKMSLHNANRICSDTWLEWSFGWSPLLSDIDSGAKALADYINYLPQRKLVHGVGQDLTKSRIAGSNLIVGNNVLQLGPIEVSYLEQVKYYGMVGITNDLGQVDFMKHFGVTWGDFVCTVWELIPYSFLVDYFTNIGAMIDIGVHGNCGLRWISTGYLRRAQNTRTEVNRVTYPGNPSDPKIEYDEVTFVPGRQGSYFVEVKTRSSYGGSLIPNLTWRIPGLGTKWINMSALAFGHSKAAKNAQSYVSRGL